MVERTLSSNTSVSEDAHSLAHTIANAHSHRLLPGFLFLQVVELWKFMAVYKIHHDDPFGNLRTVDAIG